MKKQNIWESLNNRNTRIVSSFITDIMNES